MRLSWGLLMLLGSGCITVYQPMVGLQRPVAIDTHAANFQGMRLEVNCNRNDYLWEDEAELLCARAAKLLSNQGATVKTRVEGAGPSDEEQDEDDRVVARARAKQQQAPRDRDVDLRIDLTAREVHEERNSFMWLASIASFTIVPGMSEYTFAQEVTIRDGQGFLLATDTWQARFVRYFGVAVWGINFILDRTVRKASDKVTGDVAEQEFSRDFYRQLSQQVLNAKTRWALLQDVPPPPRPAEPAPAAVPSPAGPGRPAPPPSPPTKPKSPLAPTLPPLVPAKLGGDD